MQETEIAWHLGEVHCFFPEWADRPLSRESLPEFDRNSYSAAGYAEEFGHRALADGTSLEPHPTQEPESCPEWHVQSGALHPGYPECPRPSDRDRPLAGESAQRESERRRGQAAFKQPSGQPPNAPDRTSTIRVGQRARARPLKVLARVATLCVGIRARRRELGSFL